MSDNFKLIKLLGDSGVVAASTGMVNETSQLSEALKSIAPTSAVPFFIEALLLFSENKYDEASSLLKREALILEPSNQMIKAFLVFSLMKSKRFSEAIVIFDEVKGSLDEEAIALVTALKDELMY